ncbi:MAG: HPr family phosphocarrier protein [candidate division Zixibacteria bacterium]|jgi:phosphocarrier protein|nr:HPr family phosphocarrier protein [candidate division Zixibacteria bacterium]
MVKKTTRIVNKLGLHARPSAMLVTTAGRFQSEVHFTKDGLRVNGKSIMGVMMLAAEKGSEVTVEAEGPDEEQAVDALINVIESGFNEMG